MRRSWMLAIAATFALGLGGLANAQSIPPGSYQQTCKNVDFRGDTLAANCKVCPASKDAVDGVTEVPIDCVAPPKNKPLTTAFVPASSVMFTVTVRMSPI